MVKLCMLSVLHRLLHWRKLNQSLRHSSTGTNLLLVVQLITVVLGYFCCQYFQYEYFIEMITSAGKKYIMVIGKTFLMLSKIFFTSWKIEFTLKKKEMEGCNHFFYGRLKCCVGQNLKMFQHTITGKFSDNQQRI